MLPLPRFEYLAPTTLDQALRLLAEHGSDARLVAGGTDLVPNLKHRLHEPRVLIGLAAVRDLDHIVLDDDGSLRIGALATLAAVRDSEPVRRHAQVLAEAAGQVAGPQIQNMGTLGGNLCLDTRCVYYNQTYFWRDALGYCLKKDGTVCHVVAGGKNCVAASSSDTAPALIALDATVTLASASGTRTIPVVDLYKPPGCDHLTLRRDELLTEVRIPPQPEGLHSGYAKLRVRKAIDFPIFSLAMALARDPQGRVSHLRMAATAMGATPKDLSKHALKVAHGEILDADRLRELGEAARKRCVPLDNINVDPEWRRAMIPVIVRRLAERLIGDAPPPLHFGL